MPGEELDDAIGASKEFQKEGIPTVFTYLGESIKDLGEAATVRDHYISVLERISSEKLEIEISVKLTQLGLDLSGETALENFKLIAERARRLGNVVWIDMERSNYVDATLDLYRKARKEFANTGVCLQAYLRRTRSDVEKLLQISPSIRLVKGAYNEPKEIVFPSKHDVDENYFELSKMLLRGIRENGARAAFGTHDIQLHERIIKSSAEFGIPNEKLEFQMLYGIKTNDQKRLAREGYHIRVLISYGKAWYKWYVRRLAERPANIGFVLRNLFGG